MTTYRASAGGADRPPACPGGGGEVEGGSGRLAGGLGAMSIVDDIYMLYKVGQKFASYDPNRFRNLNCEIIAGGGRAAGGGGGRRGPGPVRHGAGRGRALGQLADRRGGALRPAACAHR
ncbi:hypothetical protein GCM10022255_111960 [Dactylosporangium darangshiense]|uniref:Uncharacterized protein n=1 Tax=Dactylosporangium darangshiense TaxID=579108 RepID=A0ABP8DVE3_9ACTN